MTSAIAQGRGRASEGNPRMNCVADDLHQRPLADRGSPGRTHGNAVTNPRIRVCSTVVLTALPPAPRTRSILPQPVPDNGVAHPRPTSLTTNIRIPGRDLRAETAERLKGANYDQFPKEEPAKQRLADAFAAVPFCLGGH